MSLTFADLQQRFVAGLQRRVNEMNSCLDLLAISSNAQVTANLMRQFHSLAGIGGTYGFHNITDLARQGERACCRTIESERASDEGQLRELRALVDSIADAALARAA